MSKELYPGFPHRKPRESDKAFAAFMAYVELGPERSYRELARALGRPESYSHQIKRWVDRFDWKDRLAAYEAEILERSIENRSAAIEQARQVLVDGAQKAAQRMIAMAEGDLPEKHAAVQLQACAQILDRAGIIAPKRIELTDDKGQAAVRAARKEAKKLDNASLRKLIAIISTEPSDGERVH